MIDKIKSFIKDEEGQSAVEYALVIGIIVLGLVAAFGVLSGSITNLINTAANAIDAETANIAP